MSRQNFSTRDISRYEWGATGTIFPSSCYPVSFFAVARPRDLSFAAARFQSPLSFFLALSLFFSSTSVQRNVAASAHCSCIIRAAKPFLDQLSRSTSLPGIFSLRARESGGSDLPRERLESIYGSIRDCTSRRFCSNLCRISDYPAETSIIPDIIPPRISVGLSIRRADNMFRVLSTPWALIINYLLIP